METLEEHILYGGIYIISDSSEAHYDLLNLLFKNLLCFSRKSVISLGEISGFKSHSLDYRRWRVNENKLPTAFRQLFQEMICERKRAKRQKLNRDM